MIFAKATYELISGGFEAEISGGVGSERVDPSLTPHLMDVGGMCTTRAERHAQARGFYMRAPLETFTASIDMHI